MAGNHSHGGIAINVRCSRTAAVEDIPLRRNHGVARPSYLSLHLLKQKPGEPLRRYIQRFR